MLRGRTPKSCVYGGEESRNRTNKKLTVASESNNLLKEATSVTESRLVAEFPPVGP